MFDMSPTSFYILESHVPTMAEAACDRMRRSNLLGKRGAVRAPSRYFGGMTPYFSVMTASRSGCRRPFSA
jgi:hypothetical protein